MPPEGAVDYQTEDECGNKVDHRANRARFAATDNPKVWWVWCAWWNVETRGWHTEGCTIVGVSMKTGLVGKNSSSSSSSARRDAVVQCECLMERPSDELSTFKGSFGVIKEASSVEEDEEKRLKKDKKGDAGSLLGYIFNRIASSFNSNTIPFEVIPSAMYICFIPLALYLLALIYLRSRASCRHCPGYEAHHRHHAPQTQQPGSPGGAQRAQSGQKKTMNISENHKGAVVSHRQRRLSQVQSWSEQMSFYNKAAVAAVPKALVRAPHSRRRIKVNGREEYTEDYWKSHHDGIKTNFVIQHVFGLRAVAGHSTDRFCLSYWQFLIRNHDTLSPFLAPHDPGRGHAFYSSMLLAKYAACVAAGTALYHMHACFKLADAVLGDAGWWQGKILLAAISLVLQKVPMSLVNYLFRLERKRRRARALRLKPHKACGLFKVYRNTFAFVPWTALFLFLAACYGLTINLTSTGFLQASSPSSAGTSGNDTNTAHCGCAGITAGKDVEGDWITLLLMIVLFRTLLYRPTMILIGALLFMALERKRRKKRMQTESRIDLAARGGLGGAEIEMSTPGGRSTSVAFDGDDGAGVDDRFNNPLYHGSLPPSIPENDVPPGYGKNGRDRTTSLSRLTRDRAPSLGDGDEGDEGGRVRSGGDDDDEGGEGYHNNPMLAAMEKKKAAVAAAAAAVAAADETVEAYHSNPMTAARQKAAAATKAAAAAAASADEGVEAYHSNPMLAAKQQKAAAKAKAAAAVAAADETVEDYHSNPMIVARKVTESRRAAAGQECKGAGAVMGGSHYSMDIAEDASDQIVVDFFENPMDSSVGGSVGSSSVGGSARGKHARGKGGERDGDRTGGGDGGDDVFECDDVLEMVANDADSAWHRHGGSVEFGGGGDGGDDEGESSPNPMHRKRSVLEMVAPDLDSAWHRTGSIEI